MVSTNPLAISFLEKTKELDLDNRRQLPDLIQKEAPAVGLFKSADPSLVGAGKRSFFVSEKLVFYDGFGKGSAIDRDQRLMRSRAQGMNQTGEELFPGAAFPLDHITLALDEEIAHEGLSGGVMVRAARLHHRGKDFYAFYFPDEDGGSYFDENGKSLKGAFLPTHVSTGRVTSRFSKARLHPVSGKYTPHYGIDYAALAGTPIVSIADGVVQEAGDHRTKGKFVRIKHPDGYETEYLHMSRFEKGIDRGVSVPRGQIIGYVGTTGIATGPHVELRLKKNGSLIDLSKEKFRYASLLPATLQGCFQQRVETLKGLLEEESRQDRSDFLFFCSAGGEAGTI